MTERGLALLRAHEGTGPRRGGRFLAYQDSVGKWTIGYGRNLEDRGLSKLEIDQLLAHDVADAEADVIAVFPWATQLDDVRGAVLVMLAFNLGVGGLRGFPLFLAALHAGNWAGAARELLDSRWAHQVGARAVVLATMLETGAWPS